MIEIGRVCVKVAGRDSNRKCVIVDIIDSKFVVVDGETRRRKCNIKHLEPLDQVMHLAKNASHSDVEKEANKLGWNVWSSKNANAEEQKKEPKPSTKKVKKN